MHAASYTIAIISLRGLRGAEGGRRDFASTPAAVGGAGDLREARLARRRPPSSSLPRGGGYLLRETGASRSRAGRLGLRARTLKVGAREREVKSTVSREFERRLAPCVCACSERWDLKTLSKERGSVCAAVLARAPSRVDLGFGARVRVQSEAHVERLAVPDAYTGCRREVVCLSRRTRRGPSVEKSLRNSL